eukprot:gene2721-2759_t
MRRVRRDRENSGSTGYFVSVIFVKRPSARITWAKAPGA